MDVLVSSTTEWKYVTILIPLTAVMPLTKTFQGFRTFAVFVRHLRTPHSNVQRTDYQGQITTSYSIQTVTKSVSRLQVLLHVLYQMNFLFDTPGISRCRSQHVSVESSSLLHHSIYL